MKQDCFNCFNSLSNILNGRYRAFVCGQWIFDILNIWSAITKIVNSQFTVKFNMFYVFFSLLYSHSRALSLSLSLPCALCQSFSVSILVCHPATFLSPFYLLFHPFEWTHLHEIWSEIWLIFSTNHHEHLRHSTHMLTLLLSLFVLWKN